MSDMSKRFCWQKQLQLTQKNMSPAATASFWNRFHSPTLILNASLWTGIDWTQRVRFTVADLLIDSLIGPFSTQHRLSLHPFIQIRDDATNRGNRLHIFICIVNSHSYLAKQFWHDTSSKDEAFQWSHSYQLDWSFIHEKMISFSTQKWHFRYSKDTHLHLYFSF